MDSLKSAIADKILEVSSLGGSDMKEKLDKINRFRDFVNACQALIDKYPAIGTELLRMINKNDFDTKVASIRVDTIISLSEDNPDLRTENPKTDVSFNQQRASAYNGYSAEESLEDIGYKEIDKSIPERYIDFDEIKDYTENASSTSVSLSDNNREDEIKEEPIKYREPLIKNTTIEAQASPAKDNAKKGMQVIAIVAVIVVLIFAIVFVIQNLETVLLGLGVLVILAFIVWIILFNKKKNTEEEEE